MKKKILQLGCCILFTYSCFSQETEEGVDLLKAPSSPAAQLLNIAPNTIERPTDLSSLWISVNNNTDGLSRFPTNYALDISPASLFNSKIVTLSDLKSTKTGEVFWQSFIVSTGIKQVTDSLTNTSFYKTAVGVKFSIIRPQWSAKTTSRFEEIKSYQKVIKEMVAVNSNEVKNEPEYKKLIAAQDKATEQDIIDSLDKVIEAFRQKFMTEARIKRIANNPSVHDALKKKAREFRIERKGPFLDFAGGFSAQFPTNKLGYSLADQSGAWLTGGYEGGDNNLSILGIVRYLYQPESIFADSTGKIPSAKISTLDMGARVHFSTKEDLFTISFESIYRSVLTKSIVKPSWKFSFSAEYDLGFNKKISVSFGRDFDGMISKGGNLIAALNLITGFGNKKDLK